MDRWRTTGRGSCARTIPAVAAARLIDTMHLGLDRVIGAWERDGVLVDPGPASTIDTRPRRASRRPAAGAPAHPHPPRPCRRDGHARRAVPGPARLRPRGRARRISSTRRGCCAAPPGSTASGWTSSGARSLPVPERNLIALSGGEVVEGLEVLGDARATPPITSSTSIRPRATPSSATSAGSGSRPATRSGCRRRRPTSTSSSGAASIELVGRARAGAAAAHPLRLGRRAPSPSRSHPRRARPARGELPRRATARASSPSSRSGSAPSRQSLPSGPARRCRRSRSGSASSATGGPTDRPRLTRRDRDSGALGVFAMFEAPGNRAPTEVRRPGYAHHR